MLNPEYRNAADVTEDETQFAVKTMLTALREVEKKNGLKAIQYPAFFIFGADNRAGMARTRENVDETEKAAQEVGIPPMELFFGSCVVSIAALAEEVIPEERILFMLIKATVNYSGTRGNPFLSTRLGQEMMTYLEENELRLN